MNKVNGSMEDVFKSDPNETPEAKPEQIQQTQETQQTDTGAFKWSQYGLDPRYDRVSPEQIARELLHHTKMSGRQAQELGDARKKVADYEAKMAEFQKVAGVTPKQETKDWDEIKTQQFMKLIDEGRVPEALDLALAERLKPKFDTEDFSKAVDSRVQEHLNKFYGWQQEQTVASDPDYPQFSEYINIELKNPDRFGESRPPTELLALAKLVVENKPLADLTYMNMKEFPNMSFDKAKQYANWALVAQANADEKKNQHKAMVGKLDGVGRPKGTVQQTTGDEKIMSMDDAFASD
jgi:hypothetical protein